MEARYFIRHILHIDSIMQYIQVMGGMIYTLNFNTEWGGVCPTLGITFEALEYSDFDINKISKEMKFTYNDKVTVEITAYEFYKKVSQHTDKNPDDYWFELTVDEIWGGIIDFLKSSNLLQDFAMTNYTYFQNDVTYITYSKKHNMVIYLDDVYSNSKLYHNSINILCGTEDELIKQYSEEAGGCGDLSEYCKDLFKKDAPYTLLEFDEANLTMNHECRYHFGGEQFKNLRDITEYLKEKLIA